MSLGIVDLPWLPPAPADFKDRCSQFAQKKGGNGAEIRSLGLHALSANQLNRLHKAAKATTDSASLTPVRLAVLSNSNTEFLPPWSSLVIDISNEEDFTEGQIVILFFIIYVN